MGDLVFDDPHWDRVYKLLDDEKYVGKVVMIVDDKVVAYGKAVRDFADVVQKYKDSVCTIMRVPAKDDPTDMVLQVIAKN